MDNNNLKSEYLDSIPEGWLTPKEAADYMGVNVRTVYSWVGRGIVDATRENRTVRISRASLENLNQRRNMNKVISEVVEEIAPQARAPQKREVTSAVFVALAGLQTERQQLMQQIFDLQTKLTHDAHLLGQLEQKTEQVAEMEDTIEYLQAQVMTLQESQKRSVNLASILGIALIITIFILLVCIVVLVR